MYQRNIYNSLDQQILQNFSHLIQFNSQIIPLNRQVSQGQTNRPMRQQTVTESDKQQTVENNSPNHDQCGIIDVWAHNLEDEFRSIRRVVQNYPFIAMDTEFPGIVARPIGDFKTNEYEYQTLKCNVNLLRIIQLGLTFLNKEGCTPEGNTTWQFNFKFNLQEDMYAQDSIDMLRNSGIQFNKHLEDGIDPLEFADLLMSSGIVLIENIKWLSFHSGYDFGYLLKLLTDQQLPEEETEFFILLKTYFPTIYDVKYLMKSCKTLKGGLQEVAMQLEVERVGPQHQAGSDSLLTGMVFFKMREMFFEGNVDDAKYCGHLYRLGSYFAMKEQKGFLDNNFSSSQFSINEKVMIESNK